MTLFHRTIGERNIVLILFALILCPIRGFAAEPAKSEKKTEATSSQPSTQPSLDKAGNLPAPELTLGARAGDGLNEGFGDILAPILALKSGIVFINPRSTMNDHSAEEYNLGIGYRHLLREKGMIFGANMYYDYRETENGGTFNQAGLGLEYFSKWVDARANYYLPENHTETIDHEMTTVSESTSQYTKWDNPFARGDTIYQEGVSYKAVTTTELTQHFIQYEKAMEGFDLELGVRLPIPTVMDYADVKVFGGFYRYNRDFGLDDLNGFKGRLEIKAMPSLYLDAEVFDSKDLTGHDYYLGARMSVPFDVANISKGRNPFEGAVNGMKVQKQKTTIASRLTEMVIRDLHVQTEYSEATEETSKRTATSTIQVVNTQKVSDTLATDVIFVNQDTGNDSNPGTIEAPVQQVGTGISRGSNVFVMATVGPYLLNLEIGKNVNLMGQGFPIGHDGKYLNGDSRFALIRGLSDAPTIFVDGFGDSSFVDGLSGANSVQIRGFEIQNELVSEKLAKGEIKVPLFGSSIDVAVNSVQNFELAYNKLDNALLGLGAIYSDMPSFTANVHDNTFDTLGLGAGVLAGGSQGTLIFSRNTIQNTMVGLVAAAAAVDIDLLSPSIGIAPLSPAMLNAQITGNIVKGGGLGVLDDLDLDLGSFGSLLPGDLIDIAGLKGVTPSSENIPSISALNAGAIGMSGSATVNATFSGNYIEDNLLGIGAVGIGSNATVNVNIQNNQLVGGGLAAILGGAAFSGVASEETLDGSGIGIWMLGLDGATLDNAVIANNTITKHALGIGVLGLGDAEMNNGLIANNTISDSLLGIVVAGIGANPLGLVSSEEPVVQMNNWTITGNRVSGNGVGQIVSELLPIISTNLIPEIVNQALQEMAIPDMGLAGILVVGVAPDMSTLDISEGIPVFYTTEMNGYQITGNVIENEFLGIGVAGLGSDVAPFKSIFEAKILEMNDYTISGNTVRNNLLGILVAGVDYADMEDYEIAQNTLNGNVVGIAALCSFGSDLSGLWIHNNTIVGGGLDDLFTALKPLADTNIIHDVDIVNLLKTPLPDTGAVGVLVLSDYADVYDASIDHNAISKNLVGALVAGTDEGDMDGLSVANNTINNSVLGIGLLADDDTYVNDSAIHNNVINDPGIGILALADDTSRINNLTVSGNQINRSLIGIMAANEHNAQMTNLVISANTISGASEPAQVALLTGFLTFADMTEDIGWLIHRDWNPATFPNSGLIGVDVRVNESDDTTVRLEGNHFSNFAQAGLVTIEDVTGIPIAYINNTSADGRYYVAATNSTYTLTDSGNTPSPVLIIP